MADRGRDRHDDGHGHGPVTMANDARPHHENAEGRSRAVAGAALSVTVARSTRLRVSRRGHWKYPGAAPAFSVAIWACNAARTAA